MSNRFLPFFVNNPRIDEAVKMTCIELDSFPENNNPFHHDLQSSGTPLGNGITIMHSSNGRGYHQTMVHTNEKTGQRFALIPLSVNPTYIPYYDFTEYKSEYGNGRVAFGDGIYTAKPVLRSVSPDEPMKLVHTVAGAFVSPVYLFIDGHMLLESLVIEKTLNELIAIIHEKCHRTMSDDEAFILATAFKFELDLTKKTIVIS